STSLFFSLPATTMLSADAAFTVPLAFLTGIFFISAFFPALPGVVAGATTPPADPAANASATTKASSFFTTVPPPRKGLKSWFPASWAYDERRPILILRLCIDEIYEKETAGPISRMLPPRGRKARRPAECESVGPFRKFSSAGPKRYRRERKRTTKDSRLLPMAVPEGPRQRRRSRAL